MIRRSVFPKRLPSGTGKQIAVPFLGVSVAPSESELGRASTFQIRGMFWVCFLTDLWRAVPLVDGGAQTLPFGTWKCFPVPFSRVPVAPPGMELGRASAFQIREMFWACFLTDLWRAVPLVDGGAQTIPFGTWKWFPLPFLRVPVAPIRMELGRGCPFRIESGMELGST